MATKNRKCTKIYRNNITENITQNMSKHVNSHLNTSYHTYRMSAAKAHQNSPSAVATKPLLKMQGACSNKLVGVKP